MDLTSRKHTRMTHRTEIHAEQFTFLVDTQSSEPVIGLQITATDGQEFVVPMNLETTEQVGALMLSHVTLYRKFAAHV